MLRQVYVFVQVGRTDYPSYVVRGAGPHLPLASTSRRDTHASQ
jgi:hypothetical protein